MNTPNIDWDKTIQNIVNHTYKIPDCRAQDLYEYLYCKKDTLYRKLRNKKLSIEDLFIFSFILNCTIDELIVSTEDTFIEWSKNDICLKARRKPEEIEHGQYEAGTCIELAILHKKENIF